MPATHASQTLEHVPVLIVGGGQAGLSMSYCLSSRNIRHLVLERHRIGHAWREQRWDSFCLVTPNWQCRLPGHTYRGADPEGFMVKSEIVRYLDDYVSAFSPPVREGVEVQRVRRGAGGGFSVETSDGTYLADQVVMAAGGYHKPKTPPLSAAFDPEVLQLNAASYRNPETLPEGAVMVVGSGQSGCQIAEDLHLAGRQVHLCVGSAPRVARRYRGKDVVFWLDRLGHYALPIDRHPDGIGVRRKPNHYVTGRDGGRDIDLRKFACEGMQLHGRLLNLDDQAFEFGDDLEKNLDKADATDDRIKNTIDDFIAQSGIDAPHEPRYVPVWKPNRQPTRVPRESAAIRSVIWCMGFALDYRFIELPVFDAAGYPEHKRGVTGELGLYFLGLPWLYTWGSGRFCGVGADAEYLASCIAASTSRALTA